MIGKIQIMTAIFLKQVWIFRRIFLKWSDHLRREGIRSLVCVQKNHPSSPAVPHIPRTHKYIFRTHSRTRSMLLLRTKDIWNKSDEFELTPLYDLSVSIDFL